MLWALLLSILAAFSVGRSGATHTITGVNPHWGSLNGGTKITIYGTGFFTNFAVPPNPNLGNFVQLVSASGSYDCELHINDCTATQLACYTKPMPEDIYTLNVRVIFLGMNPNHNVLCQTSQCTIKIHRWFTPTITQVIPRSGEPGTLIKIIGKLFTIRFGSNQLTSPNGNLYDIRRVYNGGNTCTLINPATSDFYNIQLYQNDDDDETYRDDGEMECLMGGTTIGTFRITYIISGPYGRDLAALSTVCPDANNVLGMFQTYSVIVSISPDTGSIHGGTLVVVIGRNFDTTVVIYIRGVPCLQSTYVSTTQITCRTPPQPQTTPTWYEGNRGGIMEIFPTKDVAHSDLAGVKDWVASDDSQYTITRVDELYTSHNPLYSEVHAVRITSFFIVQHTAKHVIYVNSHGNGAFVYMSSTGDPGNIVKVAQCTAACSDYYTGGTARRSDDYSFVAGQRIFIMVVYIDAGVDSFVSVMIRMDVAVRTADESGCMIQEVQRVTFDSSYDVEEIQTLTLSDFTTVTAVSTEQTVTVNNIDPTLFFCLILFGVQSRCVRSTATAAELEVAMRKNPVLHETTISVIAGTSTATSNQYIVKFNNDMGNVQLMTYQLVPSTSALTVSITTTVPGIAGHEHMTLCLMGTDHSKFVHPIPTTANAAAVQAAIKLVLGVRCPRGTTLGSTLHQDYEGDLTEHDGVADTSVEAFCGHKSSKNPSYLIYQPDTNLFSVNLKLCYAYMGIMPDNYKVVCVYTDGTEHTHYPSTNLLDSDTWSFQCLDLTLLAMASCTSIKSVKLHRSAGEDILIDFLTVTSDTSAFDAPFDNQRSPAVRPGGQLVSDVQVTKTTTTNPATIIFVLTMLPSECGNNFPTISLYGSTLDSDGSFVLGQDGKMKVTRDQLAPPPIGGSIELNTPVTGTYITLDVTLTSAGIQQAFLALNPTQMVQVVKTGDCARFNWEIKWTQTHGDIAAMTLRDQTQVTGNGVIIYFDEVEEGGSIYDPVRGDVLREPHNTRQQLTADINNIITACDTRTACGYTYSSASTPTVTNLDPTQGTLADGTALTISGTGFSSTNSENDVIIGVVACVVTSSTATQIICNVGNGAAGAATISVDVSGSGYASVTSGLTFTYLFEIESITPSQGSLGGGIIVTIDGSGFSSDSMVTINGIACPISGTVEPGQIRCVTPGSAAEGAKSVVVTSFAQTVTTTFTYVAASTIINSVSPLNSNVFGGTTITLSGSGFGTTATGLTLMFGTQVATILTVTDTEITATLPSNPQGTYPPLLQLGSNGLAVLSPSSVAVEYILKVTAIEPSSGSILGGTKVRLYGEGFGGPGTTEVNVRAGSVDCVMVSVTSTMIECDLGSTSQTHIITNTGTHPTLGHGFAWDVSVVQVEVGDLVNWVWTVPGTSLPLIGIFQTESIAACTPITNGFGTDGMSTSGTWTYQFTSIGIYYYCSGDQDIVLYGTVIVTAKVPLKVDFWVEVGGHETDYDTSSGASPSAPTVTCAELTDPLTGCIVADPTGGTAGRFYFIFTICKMVEVTRISIATGIATDDIMLTGSGFSSTPCQNFVTMGDADNRCEVTDVTSTTVTCNMDTSNNMAAGESKLVNFRLNNLGLGLMNIAPAQLYFILQSHISQVSPSAGSIKGGLPIVITGVGFSGVTVYVGSNICELISPAPSYNQITCTLPFGPVGVATVVVTTGNPSVAAQCTSAVCSFVYQNSPQMITVSPSSIDGSAPQTVVISGSGFGTSATGIEVTIGSLVCSNPTLSTQDTEIQCTIQYISVGVQIVRVFILGEGDASVPGGGTLSVTGVCTSTSVTPDSGGLHGGTIIVLAGNGFVSDQTTVTVGGATCDVTLVTVSSVTCTTGSGSSNMVSITSNSVTCTNTLSFEFTETMTPTVSSILPSQGTGGTQVTIEGMRFSTVSGQNSVRIGGALCDITDESATSITCNVGDNSPRTGVTPVVHRIGYGNSDGSSSTTFTYPLSISSFNPSQGSLAGHQTVNIIGEGFNSLTTVTFGGFPATVNTAQSTTTTLVVTTPARTETVTVECAVVVISADPEQGYTPVQATASDQYTYDATTTPQISLVTPSVGGTAGGTVIVISGSGFGTVMANVMVTIGGATCTITGIISTQVTCTTGPRPGTGIEDVLLQVSLGGNAQPTTSSAARYQYLDMWSSTSSWTDGQIPRENDFVVVGNGQTILLDQSTPKLKMLLIQGGSVIFNEMDIELIAEYILVTDGGVLQVGTEENPFVHNAVIELHGHVRSTDLPIYGSKVVAVREGTLELHGKPVDVVWTLLAATADVGATMVTLQHPVDWKAGDKIVIATTGHRHSQAETEEKTIDTVSGDGRTLTLDSALQYKHRGETDTFNGVSLEVRAEVGLLTRNIVIRGTNDDQWDDTIPACDDGFDTGEFATQTCFQGRFGEEVGSNQFGAQVIISAPVRDQNLAVGRIENVEFYFVGQAFRLGRYPIHFHLNGHNSESYVKRCSIHKSFNRAVNIHGSHDILVEYNFVYDIEGGANFLEDGIETRNIFQYNLAIFVKGSSSLLNDDITAAAFWATNSNNDFLHNHVAGGTHFGFWYSLHDFPTGPSFTTSVSPKHTPLGQFKNNTAHSCGWFGLWTFENIFPLENGAPKAAVFEDFTAWFCDKGIEFVNAAAVQFSGFILAYNDKAGFEGKHINLEYEVPYTDPNACKVLNGHIIADSNLANMPIQPGWEGATADCTAGGIVLPYGGFEMLISGVTFHKFDDTGCAAFTFTRIQGKCVVDCSGFTYYVEDLVFKDSPNKVNYQWLHQGLFIDVDGSMSGSAGNRIVPKVDILPPSSCVDASADFNQGAVSASICDSTVDFNRVAFNHITPESLIGKEVQFQNEHGSVVGAYKFKAMTHPKGWAVLLVSKYTYTVTFVNAEQITNSSYDAGFYSFKDQTSFVILCWRLERLPDQFHFLGEEVAMSTTALDGSQHGNGNWHYDVSSLQFCYIISGKKRSGGAIDNQHFTTPLHALKCYYDNCIVPDADSFPPDCNRPSTSKTWSTHDFHTNANCLNSDGTTKVCATSTPANDDSVIIPAGMWMVLDISTARLYILRIEGTLEVQQSAEVEINIAFIYILKGQFIIGCSDTSPFLGTATIIIRGDTSSIPMVTDNGPEVGAKAIAVYGALLLNGNCHAIMWTTLSVTAVAGATTIQLTTTVAWVIGNEIVITASSFDPAQVEVRTITHVDNTGSTTVLTLNSGLTYKHEYVHEEFSSSSSYTLAAEVGLLTRNIQVKSEDYTDKFAQSFGGRILVAGTVVDGALITGYARISCVQFKEMGQEGFNSRYDPRVVIAYIDTGDASSAQKPSFVKKCSFHHSFSTAIVLYGANNFLVEGNVFYHTVGEAIIVAGHHATLKDNLIARSIFRGVYNGRYESANTGYFGAISFYEAPQIVLIGNAVSSSDRSCYDGLPEDCDTTVSVWSNNICHSSLMGITIFPANSLNADLSPRCWQYSGFTIWKCYQVAIYYNGPLSIVVKLMILVNNGLGFYPVVYGPDATVHARDLNKHVKFENSLVVGHALLFDCHEVISPTDPNLQLSAHVTTLNLLRIDDGVSAFIGLAMGTFSSGHNNAPWKPTINIMSYNAFAGKTIVIGVTFANFQSSRCSVTNAKPVAIATPRNNEDLIHPLYISGTTLFNTGNENIIYFRYPSVSKINSADCIDMPCDALKKAMLIDLDGTLLGTGAAATVIANSEYAYNGNDPHELAFGTGDYRIPLTLITDPSGNRLPNPPRHGIIRDDSCTFIDEWNAHKCPQYDYYMMMVESLDIDTETRRLSPIGFLGCNDECFIDLINGPQDHGWCSGYTCRKRLSLFPFLVAAGFKYRMAFSSTAPKRLLYHLLDTPVDKRVVVSTYYATSSRLDLYRNDILIIPKNAHMENGQMFYYPPSQATYTEDQFKPIINSDVCGTNFFDRVNHELLMLICGDMYIEVKMADVVVVGITTTTVDEFFGPELVNNLATFLGIPAANIRVVDISTGSGTGKRRKRSGEITYIIEIADEPCTYANCTETTLTLPYSDLVTLASNIVNAYQNGDLPTLLNLTINSMHVVEAIPPTTDPTWSTFVTATNLQSVLLVPNALAFYTTITAGSEGNTFTQQARVHLMDVSGTHVPILGVAVYPWKLQASLRSGVGSNNLATLTGNDTVDFVDGWANFSNLGLTHSGSGFIIDFNVIFPENTTFTLASAALTVTLRSFKVDLAFTSGDVFTNTAHELRFKVVDTTTNAKVDDLVWNGALWSATITTSTTCGYQGAMSGATSASFDYGTSEVTFNNLVFDTNGVQVLTITVTSTTGYSLTMEKEMIMSGLAFQSMVAETSKVVAMKVDIDYNTYGNFDFAASFLNTLMPNHPDVKFSDLSVASGSVVIMATIAGNTTSVDLVLSDICSDIASATTFTYNGMTFTLSSTMTVNGQQYYGVNCNVKVTPDDAQTIGLIVGLVVGIFLILLLIGIFLFWKLKIQPKTKTHRVTKEDEARYLGTISSAEATLWSEKSFMSIRENSLFPEKPMPAISTQIGGRSHSSIGGATATDVRRSASSDVWGTTDVGRVTPRSIILDAGSPTLTSHPPPSHLPPISRDN